MDTQTMLEIGGATFPKHPKKMEHNFKNGIVLTLNIFPYII